MKTTTQSSTLISFLLPLAVFLFSGSALAVPAAPDVIVVTQPDGTTVEAYNKGDERQNWMETKKGHTIARDAKSKKWFYVDHYNGELPVLSAVPANKNPPVKLKKHLKPAKSKASDTLPENSEPSESTDSEGSSDGSSSAVPLNSDEYAPAAPADAAGEAMSGKVLFILIEFAGVSPADPTHPAQTHTYGSAEWADFLSHNIADYFNSASYNRVALGPAQETDGTADDGVIGWITLNQGHPGAAKLEGDTRWTNTAEAQQLASAAITAADQYIDYATYDVNRDGYVDANELAINVVVAGYENSVGGDVYLPTIWGHKSSLSTAVVLDGVKVGGSHNSKGGYAIFGEVHQSSASNGRQATMGIMVHELAHLIFGFPDLYDTDGSSSGIGAFCVMAGGTWGMTADDEWSGQTPVLPSAWIKHYAGWVTPVTSCGNHALTAAGDITANALNTVSRVMTANYPDEYFLIENRQPVGYDRGLQKYLTSSFGGLAIFHIDDSQPNNKDDDHRKVDLEEADGVQMLDTIGTKAKLWFNGQTANTNGFSADSTPNSYLYPITSPSLSGVGITAISDSGIVMDATMTADPDYCYPDGYLLYEDFDGAMPHQGWTVVDTTLQGKWLYETPRGKTNNTGGSGKFAVIDGYYYYNGLLTPRINYQNINTELRSPFFYAGNYKKVYLSFKSWVNTFDSDNTDVNIRCYNGTWQTHKLWEKPGFFNPGEQDIINKMEITPYTTGASSCQLIFNYYNGYLYQWQVDDVVVQGLLSQAGFEGSSYELPNNQWRLISLPREPESGNTTVGDLFSDDFPTAQYWNDWILYKRNTGATSYAELQLTSPLEMGKGYWIYSNNAATLDVPGLPAVPVYNDDCPAGCFEIPLSKAAATAGSSLFNMVGNPFGHSVNWADIKFKVVNGTTSTIYNSPQAANAAGYVSNVGNTYNGGWQPFDDVTKDMVGTLKEFDGFFIKVLGGDIVNNYDTLTLLIPAADQTQNSPQYAAAETVSSTLTAAAETGWSVRLTAEDAANNLNDSGNVLGLLPDSVYNYDKHDLKELAPMGGDYLTIVFPHPEWGGNAGDYASDYRKFRVANATVNPIINWQFEVRTNDPQRKVTLSWSGLPEILKQCVLVDKVTGKVIQANRAYKQYTFTMNGTTRAFVWKKK